MKIKVIKNIKPEVLIAAGVFAILCLYALSIGIRNIQFIFEQKKQIRLADERAAQQPEIEVAQTTTPSVRQTRSYEPQSQPEISYNDVQMQWQQPEQPPAPTRDEDQQPVEMQFNNMQFGNLDQMLNEEQMALAQQAAMQVQARMQNMTQEERLEMQTRSLGLMVELQEMSESERQNALRGLESQFRNWMEGSQEEFPQLSLPQQRDRVMIIER